MNYKKVSRAKKTRIAKGAFTLSKSRPCHDLLARRSRGDRVQGLNNNIGVSQEVDETF